RTPCHHCAHGDVVTPANATALRSYSLSTLYPSPHLFISIPLFFGLGVLTYVLVMRGVIHASHNVQIFTTVGLSIALQNVALVVWTGDFRTLRPWHASVVIRVFGTAFNLSQVVAFVIAVALTLALFAFMKWPHTGRVMRATAPAPAAA